jgi:glycosyltransferase involved in cell wall biosynthesis
VSAKSRHEPGVLMVTGAYYPELSGGGLQCKAIIEALRHEIDFAVLTTCTDASLPPHDPVDGIPVERVHVDVDSAWSKVRAALAFTRGFVRLSAPRPVVHLHGFSQKSTLAVLLAKLLGKRLVLTLHTAEQDEPAGVRAHGRLAYWAYMRVDQFIAISSRMADSLAAAGVAPSRVLRGSNGLDLQRFRPAAANERAALRKELGLPIGGPLVLFVGFFSADKGPRVLFDAWRRVADRGASCLVYVGATRSRYYEVDPALASAIRDAAHRDGLADRVAFVEETRTIERYYRAADIFVFPSRREAFGMVLVEAMASGLPCIAGRIPGVTDEIVQDGESGLLVEPRDVAGLAEALGRLLGDLELARRLGAAARRAVDPRYAIGQTARGNVDAYRRAIGLGPVTVSA